MANVKLVSVASQIDADILAEMLSSEGIYSLQKHSEVGSYMQQTAGINLIGVDIYVTRHDYDAAKEIADMYIERSHCELDVAEEVREERKLAFHLDESQNSNQVSVKNKYTDPFSKVGVASMMIMNRI